MAGVSWCNPQLCIRFFGFWTLPKPGLYSIRADLEHRQPIPWGRGRQKKNITHQGNWSVLCWNPLDPRHFHLPIRSPRPLERSFWSPTEFPEVKVAENSFALNWDSISCGVDASQTIYPKNSLMKLCQHPLAAAGTPLSSACLWDQ